MAVKGIPPTRLDSLPTDILYIILGFLDTARSIASLGATCKGLHHLVAAGGWCIFVKTCFRSLRLPPVTSENGWAELARTLTTHSRDWDRRAFVINYHSPLQEPRRFGVRRDQGIQSIPHNIIVDASLQRRGRFDEEMVVFGAGEDVFARIQRKDRTTTVSESWQCCKGVEGGFVAGRDDTTAISIAKIQSLGEDEDLGVVVGRANGDLRLLSVGDSSFGHTLTQFRPSPSSPVPQPEVQAVDIENESGLMAVGTRDSVLLYSIQDRSQRQHDAINSSKTDPITALSLSEAPDSSSFALIRSVKQLKKDTTVVALSRSFDPLRFLQITPTGWEVSQPARVLIEHPSLASTPRTVRAILPVDMRSIASGGGNSILSSWDDGKLRLLDLRTPSLVSRVYQDNFEVSSPISSLISYGLERFIGGSAHTHMLKVFDFRWPKGYYHTDSLPCTNINPYPMPTPPTILEEPEYLERQPLCNHIMGRLCRWHSLSRHDFYRPNCNIFLRFKRYAVSPVYSMAKPSDISPTVYVGLSQTLAEFTLKSSTSNTPVPSSKPVYVRFEEKLSILETGDGLEVWDISKCQRVPELRQQSFHNGEHGYTAASRQHRLDDALQYSHELQDFT